MLRNLLALLAAAMLPLSCAGTPAIAAPAAATPAPVTLDALAGTWSQFRQRGFVVWRDRTQTLLDQLIADRGMAPKPATPAAPTPKPMTAGLNLSGAEFGHGLRYGFDYLYPTTADLDAARATGITAVRLPVLWERVQPVLGGPIDAAELARLAAFIDAAAARGILVLVDVHSYGWYNGKALGSAEVPISAFADFWGKLAAQLKAKTFRGYDLMNEPHDLPSPAIWPAAAQAATDAIRKVDQVHDIVVEGDGYSSAGSWAQVNGALDIRDPAAKLFYSGHLYIDRSNSGTSSAPFKAEPPVGGLDEGAYRLDGYWKWCAAKKAACEIGEFAFLGGDADWAEAGRRALAEMKLRGLKVYWWAGGSSWPDSYMFKLIRSDGTVGSQMSVLKAAQ